MKAANVMTTEVISVRETTTLEEIVSLLTRHRIGALPVVNDRGEVVGIVSKSSLFPQEKNLPFSTERLPRLFENWISPQELSAAYYQARKMTAGDVMNRNFLSVEADADLHDVAWLMARHHQRRVPVIQGKHLVGMISRSDLIRGFALQASEVEPVMQSRPLNRRPKAALRFLVPRRRVLQRAVRG